MWLLGRLVGGSPVLDPPHGIIILDVLDFFFFSYLMIFPFIMFVDFVIVLPIILLRWDYRRILFFWVFSSMILASLNEVPLTFIFIFKVKY